MLSFQEFSDRCDRLLSEIKDVCDACGRSFDEVRVLPVTKNHPIDAVQYAENFGFKFIGENKVKEAIEKKTEYAGSIQWDLIGKLQSNKAKLAVQYFDRIQSIDSEKLLQKVNQYAQEFRSTPIPVLLQVNTGNDPNKSGFSTESVIPLMEQFLQCKYVHIQGLMTIAPFSNDKSIAQRTFSILRDLKDKINTDFGLALNQLSMGMSEDFPEAIQEGSTIIRIGTRLYGQR